MRFPLRLKVIKEVLIKSSKYNYFALCCLAYEKGSGCSFFDLSSTFLKPYDNLELTLIFSKPYINLERFFTKPYDNLEPHKKDRL